LKVTLKGIRPQIWRRVLVPGNVTLLQLHRILQVAMGWNDRHLHQFEVAGVFYGEPSVEGYRPIKDQRKFKLAEVAPAVKTKFAYEYDFSASWKHEIEVEEILPAAAGQQVPSVVKGKRACPPEKVGGTWGYEALLEAKANPRHPARKDLGAVVDEFDPEALDLAAINARLVKVR
jgi:hypothetical protein